MFLKSSTTSDVTSMSSDSLSRHCLRHMLRVTVCILVIFLLVEATPQLYDDDDVDKALLESPDKRLARLSYFRAPYSYSRGRYGSNRYGTRSFGGGYGRYDWWRKKAVNRYAMPWENLPNTNCLRKFCRRDRDCCRRYSKCNSQAHVCYDCWYGHPCSSNRDCCERFPYCNPVLNTCGK